MKKQLLTTTHLELAIFTICKNYNASNALEN